MHSGRQAGGLPNIPGIHEQMACPFCSLQLLYCPQGIREQGAMGSSIILIHLVSGFPV